MIEEQLTTVLIDYGAIGIVLLWFMFKQHKDNETMRTIFQIEQEKTREVLNDLKLVIAKIGGVNHE